MTCAYYSWWEICINLFNIYHSHSVNVLWFRGRFWCLHGIWIIHVHQHEQETYHKLCTYFLSRPRCSKKSNINYVHLHRPTGGPSTQVTWRESVVIVLMNFTTDSLQCQRPAISSGIHWKPCSSWQDKGFTIRWVGLQKLLQEADSQYLECHTVFYSLI